MPRVGSGCQGLAELPRSAKGWQGLPRVAGAAKGWQGLPRAVSGVPHHAGHTHQPLASLRLSIAVRKRKERNSLEAEARRIANVDFCLEVRVNKVRVNKFALITNSCIRGPKGGRGALARPSPPPSFAHSIHPVWPTGTQYNARVTFTYFCTFVFLPSANHIIFAKRGKNTNGYKRIRKTRGKQHLRRFERVQAEHRRVQAEYKNLRGMPSRTVQTSTNGVQTSTNGIQRVQREHKNPRETISWTVQTISNGVPMGTNEYKRSTKARTSTNVEQTNTKGVKHLRAD